MAKNSFWDEYKLIKEIGKNGRGDVLRIGYAAKGDKEFVDVRTFYHDRDTDELMPGKGASIPVDIADEVIDGIRDTLKWLDESLKAEVATNSF